MELQMVWKSTIFTFCLIKSWSHDQSECTNIFHSWLKRERERDLKSTAADINSITLFYINTVASRRSHCIDVSGNIYGCLLWIFPRDAFLRHEFFRSFQTVLQAFL